MTNEIRHIAKVTRRGTGHGDTALGIEIDLDAYGDPSSPYADIREGDEYVVVLRRAGTLDNCSMCKGVRGGVPGNENWVHGIRVCDYCHADIIKVEREVRDDAIRACARIAHLQIGPASAYEEKAMAREIYDTIESVRLTPDGRWKSEAAMKLWGEATNRDGERMHEIYDGNGKPQHVG